MLAGERKTMASAPFLELLGLRGGGRREEVVDDDDYGKRSYFPLFLEPFPNMKIQGL